MLIIMTSPDAMLLNGKPDPAIAKILIDAASANNPVGLISNHDKPVWFAKIFGTSTVQFLQCCGRQSGDIVAENAKRLSLNSYDVLVLAIKDEDVQMGKNGGAVLVAAGWSTSHRIRELGICVGNAQQLQEVINLTAGWSGQWWFSADEAHYKVRALANLSGYAVSTTQKVFGEMLTNIVKNGGSRLNALLAVTARSLLADSTIPIKDLLWSVYPSSNSANNDSEVLSDFAHRLRTTVSRVRFAKRGKPLFIRHMASPKRSGGDSGDRRDPTDQILTLHLNPFYKQQLINKHVVVIDDCTTFGVSFGVAAAFLRKAGVASVTGVALGKFGNQLHYYEIDINSDPFAAVSNNGFTTTMPILFAGRTDNTAQQVLYQLIQ